MWRIGVIVGLFSLVCQAAWAEEAVFSKVKTVVDVLQPQVEEIYDFNGGEWRHGISASLWNFTSHEIYLGSVRAGYAFGDLEEDDHNTIYGGLKADLPGIVSRLTPDGLEAKLSGGWPGTIASWLGRYAAVGLALGYDLSQRETVVGITLGGSVSF